MKEGDAVEVKVLSVDRDGKIRLTRRELLPLPRGRRGRAREGAHAAGARGRAARRRAAAAADAIAATGRLATAAVARAAVDASGASDRASSSGSLVSARGAARSPRRSRPSGSQARRREVAGDDVVAREARLDGARVGGLAPRVEASVGQTLRRVEEQRVGVAGEEEPRVDALRRVAARERRDLRDR